MPGPMSARRLFAKSGQAFSRLLQTVLLAGGHRAAVQTMPPRIALVCGLLALALAPAAQADPVHVYTDVQGHAKVGVQEHTTPAAAGAWVETDAEGGELHVRFFFTHCISETKAPGEIVCAV
jgi:hypothetical protein